MRHRDERDAYSCEPADLRGEHATAVDDDLAVDVSVVAGDPRDATALGLDVEHARVREDRDAVGEGSRRHRVAELRRVQIAVGLQTGRTQHAVRADQQKTLRRLLDGNLVQWQPIRGCPADLPADLLESFGTRGQLDATALGPA